MTPIKQTFFILFLLTLFSCKTTKNVDKQTNLLSKHVNNDSIFLSANFPLLIIENNYLLLPHACQPDSNYNFGGFANLAKNTFSSDSLISIGSKGIQIQKIKDAFCLQGECNGNQIALQLTNKEPKGILIDAFINTVNTNFLKLDLLDYRKFSPEERLLFQPKEFYVVDTYTDSTENYFIQVSGNGYMQENEWFLYNEIKWRFAQKINHSITFFQWQTINTTSTNLPSPLFLLKESNNFRLGWYHGVGICCPQASSAWINNFNVDNKKIIIKEGSRFFGGLGQPCD